MNIDFPQSLYTEIMLTIIYIPPIMIGRNNSCLIINHIKDIHYTHFSIFFLLKNKF